MGWSFRKSSGHTFGTLKCCDLGSPGACKVVVNSTSGPADGSETAKEIRRGLRACPHTQGDAEAADIPEPAKNHDSDEVLTARVERLIVAVRSLDERQTRAAEVDQAIALDDVEAFEEHSHLLTDADNVAQMALVDLGLPVDPWPPSVARNELLRQAEEFARQAADPEVRQHLADLIDQARDEPFAYDNSRGIVGP